MTDTVKTRAYDNRRREQRALETRTAVLAAARELFIEQGYLRTTVAEIARAAGVNVDTVYAAVGRKPQLLAELVETAISGAATALPPEQREYVQRIEASHDAVEKLTTYAGAATAIQARLAPVHQALRDAAATDGDCRELWARIDDRRAQNMRRFAASLRSTGHLRADLSDETVADIVWSASSPEQWHLLVVRRGWTPAQFEHHLLDTWTRTLLAP